MGTDLVQLRREIHARPELGFCEIETAARVVAELSGVVDDIAYGRTVADVRPGPGVPGAAELAAARGRASAAGVSAALVTALGEGATGVVATVQGNRPGPVVALRCDMDALPIAESAEEDHLPAREGFASVHEGLMHACGHDGHVAIGVVLGQRLAADRNFPGEVRLVFQPAEEGVRGARTMIAAGVTRGVDIMLGLHLGIGLPVGAVASSVSDVMATEKWHVDFTGRPAHAALAPEEGCNALLGAAAATLGIHALPPFSGAVTRVNVGRIEAGTAANVVPGHAHLECELRASDDTTLARLRTRAQAVIDGAAAMHGLAAQVQIAGAAAVATCDSEIVDRLHGAAERVRSISRAFRTAPMNASDDVTLFMADVQGRGGHASFLLVGAGSPAPHHHPRFDIDERSLPTAVSWMEEFVRGGAASS